MCIIRITTGYMGGKEWRSSDVSAVETGTLDSLPWPTHLVALVLVLEL
jgi:hypothetical protein